MAVDRGRLMSGARLRQAEAGGMQRQAGGRQRQEGRLTAGDHVQAAGLRLVLTAAAVGAVALDPRHVQDQGGGVVPCWGLALHYHVAAVWSKSAEHLEAGPQRQRGGGAGEGHARLLACTQQPAGQHPQQR